MTTHEMDAALFREMPDHFACVLLWNDVDGPRTRVVVNPEAPAEQVEGFDAWLDDMMGRVAELGMARAVVVDDWQLRSDGAYQKWVRAVRLEDPLA